MGKIYCIMGKSSSGKDTIYKELISDKECNLHRVVPYTTRPIREGEMEGQEYFFCNEEKVKSLQDEGKIIELRAYDTVYGIWKYFTVDDGQFADKKKDFLLIGTLDTYTQIKSYFGEERVCPIYIEVEDGERLLRAIKREQKEAVPKYEELCRRFLADAKDFSEEKLKEAGISHRFENLNVEETLKAVCLYIESHREEEARES